MSKTENSLPAANVVVSTIGVLSADAVIPGAGSALSGLLSSLPIVKLFRRTPGTLNHKVAAQIEGAIANAHLGNDHDKLIRQMIERGALTTLEVNQFGRDAPRIVERMLEKSGDLAANKPVLAQSFRDVLTPFFRDLLADGDVATQLRPKFETTVAQSLAHIQAVMEELLARSDETARKSGIKEGLLISLARRNAANEPDDFASALNGLEAALTIAAKDAHRLPSNVDDAVNTIIARVDALNDEGKPDDGWTELTRALADHEEEDNRRAAAKSHLLGKGITQAIFRADAAGAATLLAQQVAQDHPDHAARFDTMRKVQDEWYERGRDKGVHFDLDVSIHLAQITLDSAQNADERGTAGNNHGSALTTLGERESGTDRLERAVSAYEAALTERTRDRVPPQWATLKGNLCYVALTSFDKSADPQHLVNPQQHLDAAQASHYLAINARRETRP